MRLLSFFDPYLAHFFPLASIQAFHRKPLGSWRQSNYHHQCGSRETGNSGKNLCSPGDTQRPLLHEQAPLSWALIPLHVQWGHSAVSFPLPHPPTICLWQFLSSWAGHTSQEMLQWGLFIYLKQITQGIVHCFDVMFSGSLFAYSTQCSSCHAPSLMLIIGLSHYSGVQMLVTFADLTLTIHICLVHIVF